MKPLLCCLLTVGAGLAQPRAEVNADRAILSNTHLTATLDLGNGGWLRQLTDARGRTYAEGGMVYSDWGLYQPRGLVGTTGARPAEVTQSTDTGRLWLTVAGRLAAGVECTPGADTMGYVLRYGLGDGPDLAVEVALTPSVAMTGSPAFLAALIVVPGLTEWQAWTVDGRVNELVAREGRVFESAKTPLDPRRRELMLHYGDGRRMSVAGIGAEGCPLHNVFIHAGAGGGGALFIGLLDGESPGWPAGQTWRARWTMRPEP